MDSDDEIYDIQTKSKIEIKPGLTFDEKVAISIVNIHRNCNRQNDFSKWIDENYSHLENLYMLSSIDITFDKFCTFIYDHSSN